MNEPPNARAPHLPAITGRARTRLTPDMQLQILGALKVTGSIRTACEALGVPWDRAKLWLRRARQGREPYASFARACQQAKAQRVLVLEGIVMRAAWKDWRAAQALRPDKRSARQRAADNAAGASPDELPLLVYPVALDSGADLRHLARAHGAAIDTHGETVQERDHDRSQRTRRSAGDGHDDDLDECDDGDLLDDAIGRSA